MTPSCALDQLTLAPLTPCKVVQVRRKRIVLLTFSDATFYLQFSNMSTRTQRFYSNSRWNFTVTDYSNVNTLTRSLLEVWWRVNSSLEMPSKSYDEPFLQWADNVSQSVVWGPTWEADSCAITAFPWQITNVGLTILHWHSIQPGRLYSPAALYPLWKLLATHFCQRLSRHHGYWMRTEGTSHLKTSQGSCRESNPEPTAVQYVKKFCSYVASNR